MLQFNSRGHLTPAKIIEIEISTFEETFVFNNHRHIIFQEYLLFLNELRSLNIGSFYQWLDGSFTTKKIKPNDLDVVTFIDFKAVLTNELKLYSIKRQFLKGKIDNYIVPIYPKNHRDFRLYELDKQQWLFDFSKLNKFQKGFIQLNFKDETKK